ncbi:MAG: CehA/McbA family metallohydrolase [Armatimonadetes bacterium]|nr:CehA/McbA family metallohydrolase [Armatimonadota bacterium]MDW8120777.1 CehA/McbA family metallohydrolase [Armatimonadota bacterium]
MERNLLLRRWLDRSRLVTVAFSCFLLIPAWSQRICQTPDCLMVDSTSAARTLHLYIFVPPQTGSYRLQIFDGADETPVSEPTTFVLISPDGKEFKRWQSGNKGTFTEQEVAVNGQWGIWRLTVTGPQPPKDEKGRAMGLARNYFMVRTVGEVDLYLKPEPVVLARGIRMSGPRFGGSSVHRWTVQVPPAVHRVRFNFLRPKEEETVAVSVKLPHPKSGRQRWGGLPRGSLEFLEVTGIGIDGLWQLTLENVKGIYSIGIEQELRLFCTEKPLMPMPRPVPVTTLLDETGEGIPARLEISSVKAGTESYIVFTDSWGNGVLHLLPSLPYTITASRGFEFNRQVTAADASADRLQIRLARVLKRPAGWFCGDNHAHTVYSDGNDTPAQMAAAAQAEGLDWLTLTDHGVGPLIQQVTIAHEEAWSFNQPGRFVIIPGEEFTTPIYHANIINGTVLELPTIPLKSLIDKVLSLDQQDRPITIKLNHPRWSGTPKAADLARELDRLPLMEVWNSPEPETMHLWWDLLNKGVRVLAETSTDSHNRKTNPLGGRRTYIYLGDKPLTRENIVIALREGPSFLSRGALLLMTVNGQLPGQTVSGDNATVRIELISALPVSRIALIADGQVVHTFEVAQKKEFKAEISLPLFFRWIIASAYADPDPVPLAMTNPVFVQR